MVHFLPSLFFEHHKRRISIKMEEINIKKRKYSDDEAEVHQPHKKRRKIEFDLSTNIDLPAEIMLEIFEKLSPTDFKTSLEVCKYWYDCSSTFLGWTFVGDAELHSAQHHLPPNFDEHFKGLLCSDSRWGSIYQAPLSVEWTGTQLLLSTDQLKHFGRIDIQFSRNYDANVIVEYLRDNDSVFCREWRLDAFRKNTMGNHLAVVFKLYVNVRALEAAVIGDKLSTFPKLDMVWKYGVHPEVARVIRKEVTKFKELKTPIMPYIPPKIDPPAGLKEGFKWHRYQLECISWMKSIEENTDKELKYCDLVPWRASRSNLLFDLHNEKILTPEAVSDYIGSFKSRGGILADAVGLGKTLEMIGLVLATQDRTLPEFDENGLFNTKASLIVCSGHIAIQWASEIAKFTNLKVKQITNIQEATEATYGDIVNSDFVIVATPLLKNKQFLSLGCSKSIVSLAPKALKTRANYLDGHLEEVKKKKNKLQVTGPPLDNFHFRRIIVDEAHEVFLDNFTLALLINQANNARWYVSATPFPSDDLFEAAKKFLGIWEPDFNLKKTPADQYENFVENDLMMNNLVWRNTKESIQDEYEVPDYEEQVVWVDCHPIEALHIKYDKSSERLCNLDTLKSRAISSIEHNIKWGYHFGSHLEQKQRLQKWKSTPNVKSSTPTNDEQELDEYGSKITKVVAWLKERIEEDESNRFLFFSKNNFILHRLGKLIGENDIPFVSFEGNVNQKVKKLQEFKEDNVKIMLLSLVKSASGLNLIEANHIVLLDPMSGSVEESRAYELQALGRAHRQGQDQKVKLMRFVMRDTFEEELYNRNKSSGRAAVDDQKGLLKRSSSAIQMLNRSSSAASLREVLAEK